MYDYISYLFAVGLWELMDGISIYSIQYLGWVSAVIAALLALTTIVFSQHNERVIQKSNDLARDISLELNQDKNEVDKNRVIIQINYLVTLLSNVKTYKITLIMFIIISYSLAVCWLFGGIAYSLDAKTVFDSVLVVFSSFILIILLVILPLLMFSFNKSKPLNIDKHMKLDQLVNFLNNEDYWKGNSIVSDLLQPVVKVSLTSSNLIRINLRQHIPISGYTVTFRFVTKNEDILLLHLRPEPNEVSTYITKSETESKMYRNFTTLFRNIKKLNLKESKVYVVSETEKLVFSIMKAKESTNQLEFKLGSYHNQSIILPVKELLLQEKSILKFNSTEEHLYFELNNK